MLLYPRQRLQHPCSQPVFWVGRADHVPMLTGRIDGAVDAFVFYFIKATIGY